MICDPRKELTLKFKNCRRAVEMQLRGFFFFQSPKTIPVSQPKRNFCNCDRIQVHHVLVLAHLFLTCYLLSCRKKLPGRSGSLSIPCYADMTCSFLFYAVITFSSCLSFPRESFWLTNYAQEQMVAGQLHACF